MLGGLIGILNQINQFHKTDYLFRGWIEISIPLVAMTERNTDEELVLTKNIFEKKCAIIVKSAAIIQWQINFVPNESNTYSAFPFPISLHGIINCITNGKLLVSLSYTHIKKNGP